LQYELAHFKGNMGHDATSDGSLNGIIANLSVLHDVGEPVKEVAFTERII
jgi:hypothetical protein